MATVKNIALNNKYTKWYCSIIEKALVRSNNRKDAKLLLGYVEGHHIIPKCFKTDNNDVAFLTAKEHFVVHHLLCKMFDDKRKYYQMSSAFMKMCCITKTNESRKIISARFYDSARREFGSGRKGIKVSQESKNKMSIAKQNMSEETKKKMSLSAIGKKLSEEHKKKISLSTIGKKKSEEHKKKLSLFMLGNTKFLGKHHTEEYKCKSSLQRIGKKKSEETKNKMSIAKQNMTEETKKKMSASKQGHLVSDATRLKLSNIAKNRSQEYKEEYKDKMAKITKLSWQKRKKLYVDSECP